MVSLLEESKVYSIDKTDIFTHERFQHNMGDPIVLYQSATRMVWGHLGRAIYPDMQVIQLGSMILHWYFCLEKLRRLPSGINKPYQMERWGRGHCGPKEHQVQGHKGVSNSLQLESRPDNEMKCRSHHQRLALGSRFMTEPRTQQIGSLSITKFDL